MFAAKPLRQKDKAWRYLLIAPFEDFVHRIGLDELSLDVIGDFEGRVNVQAVVVLTQYLQTKGVQGANRALVKEQLLSAQIYLRGVFCG
ncbi:MAG: hypothetical protein DDT35_00796 [Firmicutes bacterium]|nr:hypothetical protein [Bacillota bacterium]